jgi:hypothetical protein
LPNGTLQNVKIKIWWNLQSKGNKRGRSFLVKNPVLHGFILNYVCSAIMNFMMNNNCIIFWVSGYVIRLLYKKCYDDYYFTHLSHSQITINIIISYGTKIKVYMSPLMGEP